MKILIAEDNEDSRIILKKNLESAGYEVRDAPDGLEALKLAKKTSPDIIISDILMPEMDGFQLCREVKADRKLRNIPFVFFTATYTDPEDERLARSLGACRFILKPLENDKFLTIINEVIQGSRDQNMQDSGEPVEEEIELLRMHDDSLARILDQKLKELENEHRALLEKESELRASEEKYRKLIESANDAIFVADAESGIIIDANNQAEILLGTPVEKIIGMYQSQLHPPEDARKYKELFQRHVQSGQAISEDIVVVSSSGENIPVEISASTAQVGGKTIIQGIFRDIRERKHSEKALNESRDRTNKYINVAGVMLVVINSSKEISLMNKKGAEVLCCRAEEVIGKNWFDNFIPESIRDKVSTVFEKLMDGEIEPVEYFENPVLTTKGEERLIAWHNTILSDETGNITGTLSSGEDITERRKTETSLMESEDRFRTIFETTPVGISLADAKGNLIQTNRVFQQMLGYSGGELSRKFSDITHPDDVKKNMELFMEMVSGRRDSYWIEKRYVRKDKSIVWVNLTVTAIRDTAGNFKYNFAVVEDITEKKKLEEQLRHAQKMEAIGQLAGGVAHDFNNLLTAITGYGNLIKMKLQDDPKLLYNINQILEITARGASLTQGLLAFSRKQVITPRATGLNELIGRIGKLLPRMAGEEIQVELNLSSEELTVLVDGSQIEQVIINLASNAYDAMPGGGRLTIETDRIELDNDYILSHGYGEPGIYALISVSDTGTGIDEEVMTKIFEPFFTTKDVGEGTGLGLAMAYGIIKQHSGYVDVYSELRNGTTFRIYLPIINREIERAVPDEELSIISGTETILIAEDEAQVRDSIKGVFREFGFNIIEAVDGEDAIEKFKKHKNEIQLLIFDVIMPKKSGKEAYQEIKQLNPDIKVLFMSGHNEKTINAKGIFNEGLNFILKPFSPYDILMKTREVLSN